MIGNTNISDIYMTVLGSMSTKDKLELIAKLSDSISKEKKEFPRPNIRTCFKGDWSNVSARGLRSTRYHGRKIETW